MGYFLCCRGDKAIFQVTHKLQNPLSKLYLASSRYNGCNFLIWLPIIILRPLFTLQHLILPARDPFHTEKGNIIGEIRYLQSKNRKKTSNKQNFFSVIAYMGMKCVLEKSGLRILILEAMLPSYCHLVCQSPPANPLLHCPT